MNRLHLYIPALAGLLSICPVRAQTEPTDVQAGSDWERTRKILDCAPRLVDRRELVEDQFDHRYITNNPRDIEVGYFSVEPITYVEQGRRFCETLLPASGVSDSYFRGYYITTYSLPGEGLYRLTIRSHAMIFNNEPRMINAQNTMAELTASHHLEMDIDSVNVSASNHAYEWNLEIGSSGSLHGEVIPGEVEMTDMHIPAGFSRLEMIREVRGPATVVIRESVIFRVETVSAFRYDPIFQAVCLFSLDPLAISTRILPCEE